MYNLILSLLETDKAGQKPHVLWHVRAVGDGNKFYFSFSNLLILQIVHDEQALFP